MGSFKKEEFIEWENSIKQTVNRNRSIQNQPSTNKESKAEDTFKDAFSVKNNDEKICDEKVCINEQYLDEMFSGNQSSEFLIEDQLNAMEQPQEICTEEELQEYREFVLKYLVFLTAQFKENMDAFEDASFRTETKKQMIIKLKPNAKLSDTLRLVKMNIDVI